MRRGEIRRCRFAPPDKERPVLILARNDVIGALVTSLHDEHWPEVQHALLYACGFPNHAH